MSTVGHIYLVATPIGNLSDITYRAVETLKHVDFIACEDTRTSSVLLSHYEIKKPLIAYHDHNEKVKSDYLISLCKDGKNIALISDAGTPGISDPAFRLVQAAIREEITIIPIPGACAAITAVISSGLPTDSFYFGGFLPHKKGRHTKLKSLAERKETIVLYESPFRIHKLVKEIFDYMGDRQISIGREMTKKFESFYRGNCLDILANWKDVTEKGEFVICISGMVEKDKSDD